MAIKISRVVVLVLLIPVVLIVLYTMTLDSLPSTGAGVGPGPGGLGGIFGGGNGNNDGKDGGGGHGGSALAIGERDKAAVIASLNDNKQWVAKDWAEYPGARPTRLHGVLGLRPDGTPGYNPLPMPDPFPPKNMAAELRNGGFYSRLSAALPLDRDRHDDRDVMCNDVEYDYSKLPSTSVVFVFHNEFFHMLMRSVHSVLNNSPPPLLKEIILVDDGSTEEELGQKLEDYIALLPKVRVIRLPERSGLVKGRLAGARAALGDTFTILDSHIETNPGWLEPLMEGVARDRTNVMMPQIDSIDPETFDLKPFGIGCSLGMLWRMVEHGMGVQQTFRDQMTSRIDISGSPTMAGGLFSADKEFFFALGGYDEQFGFWGAENLEFSFRIWMCGGQVMCAPCSRVNHAFRKGGSGYSVPAGHVMKNKLRTAAIWMDDYAQIAYEYMHAYPSEAKIGPIDEMLALREELQCKDYDWFLKNVYPENFLTDKAQLVGWGEIRAFDQNFCLDTMGGAQAKSSFGVTECHGRGGSQHWVVTTDTGIRHMSDDDQCLSTDLTFYWCNQNRRLLYTADKKIVSEADPNACLTIFGSELSMKPCDGSQFQFWITTPYKWK